MRRTDFDALDSKCAQDLYQHCKNKIRVGACLLRANDTSKGEGFAHFCENRLQRELRGTDFEALVRTCAQDLYGHYEDKYRVGAVLQQAKSIIEKQIVSL